VQACLCLPPATDAVALGGHQKAGRQHLVPNQPRCCAAAMLGRCPIYWMRIDPAADWLAPAVVQQLPHMWGHQLLRSREVRRGLQTARALASGFAPVVCATPATVPAHICPRGVLLQRLAAAQADS
jgi:hypothetical protein